MKKSLSILVCLLLAITYQIKAQVGSNFPSMSGQDLNDKNISFPIKGGKPTLLVLAYSTKSQADLESWIMPLYKKFGQKSSGVFGGLDDGHDIDIYFVPMIRGINKTAFTKIEAQMKKNTDKILKPYVVLYKGSLTPYKKILSLDSKNKPYLYLVNQKGKIVYATSSGYSAAKLNALQVEVDKCY